MHPKDIGDLVRNARASKRWSQEDLGRAAGGVGQSTIDRIEKGSFKRMPSDLPRICAALEIPLPELGGRADYATMQPRQLLGARDFPIYASAEGGPGEVIRSVDPIDFVPRPAPVAHVKDAYGLLVTGTSMEREFRPGETALVNPHLPIIAEEPYVFYQELQGEARATIKILKRAAPEKWRVGQLNPPKEFDLPRKHWRWAHRIFGKFSRP